MSRLFLIFLVLKKANYVDLFYEKNMHVYTKEKAVLTVLVVGNFPQVTMTMRFTWTGIQTGMGPEKTVFFFLSLVNCCLLGFVCFFNEKRNLRALGRERQVG